MCHFSPLHLLVLAIVQKKDLSAMRLVTFCTSRWRNNLVTVNFKKKIFVNPCAGKTKNKALSDAFCSFFSEFIKRN